MSVYARFRAFGPMTQHKYHLYTGSQGGNISRGLMKVVGAAILFCGSTASALLRISDYRDIGLPFSFGALLRISSSTVSATCDLLVISFGYVELLWLLPPIHQL